MADDQIEYEEELSREDLAIHEAGHAIAFLLAGCPFHSVTIEEEVTEHGILDGSIIPDPKRAERFSKQNPPMAAIMYFVNACAADVAVAKSRGKETTPFIMRDAEDEWSEPLIPDQWASQPFPVNAHAASNSTGGR